MAHPSAIIEAQPTPRPASGWLAAAGWLFLLSYAQDSILPRLASPGLQAYLLQPLLWLGTGACAAYAWWRARQSLPAANRRLLAAAAVAAVLQVALAIVGGTVDGFRPSLHAGRLGPLLLTGWATAAQLVGLELVRWWLVTALRPRGAGWALAAGALVPWLTQSGLWTLALPGTPVGAATLVGQRLLPAATESLLATYLTMAGGAPAALGYRGILAAFDAFSPVLPDLHWPTAALLALGGPLAGWLVVSDRLQERLKNRALEHGIATRTADLSRANALLLAQIVERQSAEEMLQRRNRELATLNAVAAAVASLELELLVEPLTQLLAAELGIRAGALYSYEADGHLRLRAAWGAEGRALAPAHIRGLGSLTAAAGGAQGVRTPPALADALSPALSAGRGSRDVRLFLPLRSSGEPRGALCLYGVDPASLSASDRAFYEALAAQVGVAMRNASLYAEVRAGRERLQALSRRLVEAQEVERRNIARELHDEAAQALTSLQLGLGLLERRAGDAEASRIRVAQLKEIAERIAEGLHRLATDLRPASLDHAGLVPALRQYTGALAAEHGLELQLEAVGLGGERLAPQAEAAVFRIVQEALANVVRHAQATRAGVILERRDGHLLVIVEDDGAGFDLQRAAQGERLGLLGMRERAEMLGGTLSVETAPGKGTTVTVEVPYVSAHPGG